MNYIEKEASPFGFIWIYGKFQNSGFLRYPKLGFCISEVSNINPLVKKLSAITGFCLFSAVAMIKLPSSVLSFEVLETEDTVVSQQTDSIPVADEYPAIDYPQWVNPVNLDDEIPISQPLLINRESSDQGSIQYLGVISIDRLGAPLEVTRRQRTLVTQWSRTELRAYAYEYRREGNVEFYDPNPVEQGLLLIDERRVACGSSFCEVSTVRRARVARSCFATPELELPEPGTVTYGQNYGEGEEIAPEENSNTSDRLSDSVGGTNNETGDSDNTSDEPFRPSLDFSNNICIENNEPRGTVQIKIGSSTYLLEGAGGVFPISETVASALSEASETGLEVLVIVPQGRTARIGQDTVEQFQLIYQ